MYSQFSFKTIRTALALAALMLFVNSSARSQQIISPTTSVTPATNVTNDQPTIKAPAAMPKDVPQIATGYEAPSRRLPPVERVGVDGAEPMSLTLNEAIRLALEHNNDIDASRIDVEMAEQDLKGARGAYDMNFSSESFFERSSMPISSFLGGSNSGNITETNVTNEFSFSGLSPWAGGSYKFGFSASRVSSNNFFNDLNPTFASSFSFTYTQPLLRGRRTDDSRRQIEIAKKNLSLTDVQFRQRATDVIARVEQAYWELVYSLRNLQVQMDAVRQARAQVMTNQRQVKQGVLAPIDVVEAEAQVKKFEQNVYSAQEEVTRSENSLKTLLLPDRTAEIWSRALVPVTPVELEAPRMLLSDAVNAALTNRLELAELQTTSEVNEINSRFYRDQTKPQMDLIAGYSSNGLAGSLNDRDENPLYSGLTSIERRINELSAIAGLPTLPAATFGAVPGDMTGAYGQSLANMLGQSNPTIRVGVRISLPFKNRTAQARLGRSLAEARQIDTLRTKIGQAIEADVRNSMQAVRSVEARLAAAAAARSAAEQQYTSEQRRFQAGTSTVFLVLDRQLNLVNARGTELQAQTDLNKAVANLQRAMGNTFTYRSVAVRTGGGNRLELTQTTPDAKQSTPHAKSLGEFETFGTPSTNNTISGSDFLRNSR